MPYANSTAEFRPELQVKVEEAMLADSFFIGEAIFPIFGVATRKGFYKRIKRGKGQLLANPGRTTADDPLKRATGTAYREVTRTFEMDYYLTTDRGLKEVMDDVLMQDEARFFDAESATAGWLMRNMRIARECRIAATVFNPAVYDMVLTPLNNIAFTDANIATFDFANLLKLMKRTIKKRAEMPNTLVISEELWDLVTSSTLLRQYFFGTSAGNAMIDEELVCKKFGIAQILIGGATFDTTKPGKDSSDDNLIWTWSSNYIALLNVQGGPPEAGGFGRTFVLEDLTAGSLFVTETYRDEDKRSNILRVRQDEDIKIINENSGVLAQVVGFPGAQ